MESSLAQIFIVLHRRLVAIAYTITRHENDAEDVVQRAFVRALEIEHAQPDQPVGDAWLYTAVRHLAIDHLRWKQRRREDTALDEIPDVRADDQGPPTRATDELIANVIERAELPPALRSTFEARFIDGLSYEAIAERLGIPTKTVGSRLLRARALVKRAVASVLSTEFA
jgi:RNA polymerase sigma-70 factor (ECF subfamily)